MRVKINSSWYDSENMPVCVELTSADRAYIDNMPKDANKVGAAPDDAFESEEEFLNWMKE